ncbi:hypothetical protein LAZ67_10004170 [Cordylochernes scorpioides]|uniref:Cuticle protein 14 n=1 Tax=Cordylochernes scorpioides TaxID=51811 RepID=A0ABY6KXH0_9ARAC|nr:hypothetical protein LAZ67_10004170 [Cordylochernes scorpioides]
MSQVLIALFSLFAISRAVPLVYGVGASSQYRSQDNLGNYAFGYDEGHATGGTFRKESGSPGVKVGSYGLRDADGRYRTVNYVADALGFRADIQTNEPGVEPKDPAAVTINKAPAVVVPAAPVVAPLPVAPAVHVAHAIPAAPVVSAFPVAHVAAPGFSVAPAVTYHGPLSKGYSYTHHTLSAAPAYYHFF